MSDSLVQAALDYHRFPTPGKISVTPTKDMTTQRDLGLAYSPGVAHACLAIRDEPLESFNLTVRGNLVAVISNGTAVLGLGNIGALASKPVMEGKGCLFKKFAGIDVFDIEIDETDPDMLIETIARLEPTFGGINLEDIKAPECFYIEKKLRERMKIPVFHDDQHGTAIIVAAAVLNGLKVVGKKIEEVRLVCSGAGAAAMACLNVLVGLGLRKDNILLCDSKGVVRVDRGDRLEEHKAIYARDTAMRTLADAIPGADIFLGLSAAGVLTQAMVSQMAPRPLILALANPDPEISPELAKAVRPDAILATGRSDYPNQVNNVLCFPFIFRGALDVGASTINEEMKLAAVRAIAELAQAEQSDVVASVYGAQAASFGPDYLIPAPFDPRLILKVAPAVASAAMETGVATRPLPDIEAYRRSLQRFVYTSGTVMQPVFAAAAQSESKRIAFAEGEDSRVLRAAQIIVDENLAHPMLIGRPEVIARNISDLGLRLKASSDVTIVGFNDDDHHADAAEAYYQRRKRHGLTLDMAKALMRSNGTALGAMLLESGAADGLLCGTLGAYDDHLRDIEGAIGLQDGVHGFAAMNLLQLPRHTLFICDTYVNLDPDAEEITNMTLLAAAELQRFGIVPRVALLSHSDFGTAGDAAAEKMRQALQLIVAHAPDLEIDGEMRADTALSNPLLARVFPGSRLTGDANLLIMPNLGAANITFNALKIVAGQGITVGPILLGAAKPAHILTPTTTVRGIVNMAALTAVGFAKA